MNNPLPPLPYLVTGENQRFTEFCDSCRQYRYIGLCYGPPGVGKTLSARHYARWDKVEAFHPYGDASSEALSEVQGCDTVFYTAGVANSPRQIEREIHHLCGALHTLNEEPRRREKKARLEQQCQQEEQEQQRFLYNWNLEVNPEKPGDVPVLAKAVSPRRILPLPTRLILVDEADRLKMASLEQMRDLFDRGDVGLVLIGMPGIEKRLARYPQLYSRVGFVHAFRPLTAQEVRHVLTVDLPQVGLALPGAGVTDEEAIAAIVRITGGNFRLLHRLLSQVGRILEINGMEVVTRQVVEAARESLVIGAS